MSDWKSVKANQEWQDRCLKVQTERDEWRETARSEMAGRRAAEAEVARYQNALTEAVSNKVHAEAEVERLWAALDSVKKLCEEGASLSLIFWRVDAALATEVKRWGWTGAR